MAINAELFDGTILEFPDGTDPSVIQATAKRMTLERQMAGGEMPRNELGEVVAKDPRGSAAYQAISSIVDPIRPYVEPVTDYIGDQASLAAAAGLKGVANLQTSVAQSQVAGMMELQEARKAKYGTFENMPPKEQKNYLEAQKYIEGKLGDVAKLGLEKKEIEKKYGVRESTKALDSLSESPEYKDASFIGKMGMIGSKISDDPIGIITDLGLESIPQSYAIASAAIATRFGMLNPKIAAGVGGASSGMMQFGSEYAALREQGLDHKEAWEKAGVKSGVVGLFDAASFYSAGKAAGAVMDNIKKGAVKETVKEVAKETGKQASLGAAGEGFGSAVIGQEVDPLELTKEAIGEVFGAPGDAISTYQGKVAEARAAGKPDPEPPVDVAKMMADKGFSFKKQEAPVVEEEFAGAPQIDITGVGQVPAEAPAAPVLDEQEAVDEAVASQDLAAMLAELEDERAVDQQLKQVSVQEPVVEEAPVEEKAPEFAKAVNVKDFNPEDKATIRAMEVERNKIGREKKLFPAFLAKHGVQNAERKDLGLEGIVRPRVFRDAAISFDELTSRAIQEGFLVSTGDDVQDVANMREHVADYLGSGVISTGPDTAREGQVRAIDDAIQEIIRKYEQPAPMELTGQTPDEARVEAEALELQRAEEQRVVSEQQRAEQEARDRAEIARRSEGAAEDFQLGQTAEENLTGQKDIFAEPKTKTVTDDEGEKLSFPLFVDSSDKGYKVLGFDNPRTYKDKTGRKFRTIEKDGVRLALESNKVLFKQQGKESGKVATAIGNENDITFEHLTVDPGKRNQGLAKQAIQDLVDIADKNGYTVYLEPAQLEKQGMTKEQLSDLYSKFGFVATNKSGSPMVRKPGAKKPRDMGSEAYPFVETKAPKVEGVDVANVPLGDFQNGIIMGLNGENINSNLISDDAITLLKANELISVDGSGKVSLLPKGKSLSNAMYQARDLSVEGRKELFAKFIPQIATETKVKPTEEDPDADIPFNIERKQTSTPAFKKWFGKSKVVDENGKPLVVYHGTLRDFTQFKPGAKKATQGGEALRGVGAMFFSANSDLASAYSGTAKSVLTGDFFAYPQSSAEGGNVMPVYLSLQNPLVVDAENQMYSQVESIIKKAKKDGYDGVILKNLIDQPGAAGSLQTYEHTAYVAFSPNQIKSATGNIGTFDETNPDIRFDIKARAAEPPAYAEEAERRPSLRVGIKRLLKQFNEGKIAPETLTNRIEFELDYTKDKQAPRKRIRGADIIREKLLAAKRRGELSEEAVNLAEWFILQKPELVDDLAISIKAPKEGAVASGYYNPMSRIFTLMKHSSNDETAVHEMLHHMERMLPDKVQDGIRKSWFISLAKAAKAADKGTDKNLQKFYKSLLEYHVEGDRAAMRTAENLLENGDVDYEHYQHINPSEFWAVNASDIVAGRYAQSKSIVGKLRQWLKELGQKLKSLFGLQSSAPILRALDSLAKADGRFVNDVMIGEATQYLNRKNYKGGQAPLSAWQDPQESKLDNFLYKIQDKLIDTKRVQQAITQQVGEIEDQWNAYMKEELYHGRTAKRTQDFLKDELAPIVKELAKAGIEIIEFDQFLHNRHAEERNVQIAKINPNMPDSGSGIATADAQQYMKDLDPTKRKLLEKLANKIDDMVQGTQKILIDSGLEEKSTIDAWNSAYKHYVPLKREDVDFVHTGTGLGQGFATRGGTSARATGSLKNVAEIFANIALQRERAIIRAEKARVGKALYGLAIKNPNPDFWLPVNPDAVKNKGKLEQELINMGLDPVDAKNLIQEPRQQYIDPRTGLVAWRVNPILRTSDNVFPVRINGQDRFIFFNSSDERAMRMVSALKNLDADQLGFLMNGVSNITRWIASVNTQYNPVFGAINFFRDVQGAALNLSTTPLAGKKKEIIKNTFPALKGIYSDLRNDGKGGGMWADLWEDFQEAGGQTGYRDQFSRNRKQASIVEREMGAMKRGNVKKAAYAVAQWLSDYNDSMENAVRLSAYKSALDMGLSKDQAASIAKNLTVNFNRKGTWAQTTGALYAFFNASVQGTTRLVETMKGPAGRKIFYGGVALGTLQAIALAAAGFDDDEPPEFIKSRNLIIPTGGKTYIAIPMPLGFNLFPNLGRLTTEFVISGGEKPVDKTLDLVSMVFNTFNPVGGSGLQLVAPTIADPLAALYTNVDAFGRPISKEDRKTAPTPGYTRSREQASTVNKYIAEFLNYASGGTKYQKGAFSPTADQLDYLVGQATGGVGRETMKAVGAVKALATGEELPSYKVPLAGKFYGNTESPANIASKFYSNVTQLANYENEIKGRQKNRENVGEFLKEHPEARLYQRANQLENQITKINREKKALQERNAPQKQIDVLDKRKTMLMDKFNKDYKKASN